MRKFGNYDLEGMPPVLAWNPIAMRCTPVDAGCANCWHLRMADRLAKNPTLPEFKRKGYAGIDAFLLNNFISPNKPSVIATQFMGDLWHECIFEKQRETVLRISQNNQQHIFLILTKRPENITEELPDNCWLGTSVHDQESADKRVRDLLKAKCKHKWLSVEPMLGAVDIRRLVVSKPCLRCGNLDGEAGRCYCGERTPPEIEFVACGPETGAGARPCESKWINDLAGQCFYSDFIPFYDKRDPSVAGFTRREWPGEWCEKVGSVK